MCTLNYLLSKYNIVTEDIINIIHILRTLVKYQTNKTPSIVPCTVYSIRCLLIWVSYVGKNLRIYVVKIGHVSK